MEGLMAKDVIMQVRMDNNLKHKAEELYSKLGTSFAEAIRIFAAQSVELGAIPFSVKLRHDNKKGLGIAKGKVTIPDNFDDMNEEIENMFYGVQ